jgi:hypothetical protein
MTDARFPERWLNDRRILRLPDDAFRLFVISLAWSVANRTDGRIYDDDLALIPASTTGSGQLAKAGLWERAADYWLIAEFEETQTTRDDLEALARGRRAQRDKKRRQRAAKAARAAAVPGDVPGDVSRDTPRTGQDRTGALRGSNGQQRTCAEPGCPQPPRHGCRTCGDHAYLEVAS